MRSVLLSEHLTRTADGGQQCNSCVVHPFTFSAKSESTAWRKHFERKHPAVFRAIELACAVLPPGAAAAGDTDVQSVSATSVRSASTASLSSNSQPVKKQKVAAVAQPSVRNAFAAFSSRRAIASLARSFTRSSIAHAVVETNEFRDFLHDMGWHGAFPSRAALKESVLRQADDLRTQLTERMAGAAVSIAADGWTNVRQEKITNVVSIINGVAFFWTSIVNAADRNTAEWLAAALLPVLHTLIHEHKARVIAFVVDNEAVNRATHKILQQQFPHLIHVPCAAHTVQLVVRSCLAHATFAPTMQQLTALINHFHAKANRLALRHIQNARGIPPLAVLKPCDTRWSSQLVAAERLQRMQKEIVTCYDSESLPAVKPDFFAQLALLITFLKPFQTATDAIQRDTATLYTVYEQFIMLQQHVKEQNAEWAAVSILKRWKKHTNTAAVTASAILSFARPSSHLSIADAQQFIVSFGSEYLLAFHNSSNSSRQQLEDALTIQIAEFNGRCGRFANIEQQKASVQRGGVWNPRMVWLLHPGEELADVAAALLSVSASEAAVERTFSAQVDVHSKKRNRLHSATIEAEMMLKFNSRALTEPPPFTFGSCREIDDDDIDDAAFAEPDEEELAAASTDEDEPDATKEPADEQSDEEQPAAASVSASASASARRRARREQSITFNDVGKFVTWFIRELKLTATSNINSDIRNSLQRHSFKLIDSPTSKELERLLRAQLALFESAIEPNHT
jgi:hypothetical protein